MQESARLAHDDASYGPCADCILEHDAYMHAWIGEHFAMDQPYIRQAVCLCGCRLGVLDVSVVVSVPVVVLGIRLLAMSEDEASRSVVEPVLKVPWCGFPRGSVRDPYLHGATTLVRVAPPAKKHL